ncbi:lipid A deacylase LpxR family protein [Flammeovirgaceae bacterium SG7u.111]|nr:lipid A deacylase LpxR family protein [Flammeovirgaceae bacterium SG7u.132]WPO34573.1 lipid A deacylase LpxR family protein [Flammeovirgaceae bacterium SG7u.111]
MNPITLRLLIKAAAVTIYLLTFQLAPSAGQNFDFEAFVRADNDVLVHVNLDRYYTNGLEIGFRKRLEHPNFLANGALLHQSEGILLNLSVAQQMYTTRFKSFKNPENMDRPYAGWLFANLGLGYYFKQAIIQANLDVGIVGPSSLSYETQYYVHEFLGVRQPQGWDSQIANHLSANLALSYRHETRLVDNFSLGFGAKGSGGITQSNVEGALFFRWGKFHNLGNSMWKGGVLNNPKRPYAYGKEFFIAGELLPTYVVYNSLIEGGMFENESPLTATISPFMLQSTLSFNYSGRRTSLQFVYHLLSKELEEAFVGFHAFGRIQVGYRF